MMALALALPLADAAALEVPTGPFAGPALEAVRRGDCEEAVGKLNEGIRAKDGEALLWAGRMFDVGSCVAADPERATRFFEAAVQSGNADARVELAIQYGLGVGVAQDYRRAGELAREAHQAPSEPANDYSVGYAVTVRGVAQRRIVDSIPADLLRPGFGGEIFVLFSPGDRTVNVQPGPQFAMRSEARTGSHLRRGRTDVIHITEDVWREAMAKVPPPDKALLVRQALTLKLSIDVRIEPIDPNSLTRLPVIMPKSALGG